MKSYKEFSSIQLCVTPVDFRKGLFSLAAGIENYFGEKPILGSLFLFTNKTKKNIRALYWDKTGFSMWVKSLEKDRFPWPKKNEKNKIILTHEQMQFILNGIDPWKLKPHKELTYSIL